MRKQAGLLWAGVAYGAAAVGLCGILAWQMLFNAGAGDDDGVTRLLRSYTAQITKCARTGMPRSVCIGNATQACMADHFWRGNLDDASTACARLPLRQNQ